MNTVKQWLRATCALGFALVLTSESSSAAVLAEALPAESTQPQSSSPHAAGCDPSSAPSMIAYSSSPTDGTAPCSKAASDHRISLLPGAQGRRFAEPASDSPPYRPASNRRYSF
ncbi:hypothetical protein GFL09_18775 [Pseudomonas stutzeri]|uniref:Uncharacterized protein n=1 Tax=Stutzerimonas stutzeri KOS6 TaxID=1218352 RepID=A0A061JVW5_STUST|nr:hypothetical protein [Stutzerimonas stutzeri]EWC42654.1 hypothetical protein B597_004395 [Stutzerimonas stutzeri KOS6]MBK3869696.1 hypothetical protein [Stutzerimonas stutzeri]